MISLRYPGIHRPSTVCTFRRAALRVVPPQGTPVNYSFAPKKIPGRGWCAVLHQDDRDILAMDALPSKMAAQDACRRIAQLHGGRSVIEVAGDRQIQLLAHAIRAEHDPGYVDVLRGHIRNAQHPTREAQLAAEREEVRRTLRDPVIGLMWSVHAGTRSRSEALALGHRAAYVDSYREQLEHVERHLEQRARQSESPAVSLFAGLAAS